DPAVNLVHAATKGTQEGLMMALSVGAMLIVFVALIAMLNALIAGLGFYVQPTLAAWFGWEAGEPWSLQMFVGWLFWPFAWVMGVPYEDCDRVGRLFGLRIVTNEFLSFEQFGTLLKSDDPLSPRAAMLATFAMCGFANLGSIGIQIGGMKDVMPDREKTLAKLGFRAMLGGTLATFMTACVAGVLISEPAPAIASPAPVSSAVGTADLIDSPAPTSTVEATAPSAP
ncbi:MAG TPA: nucleoside transporter C-terminal domain-containing protein, partial [Pirellulales bacterium]